MNRIVSFLNRLAAPAGLQLSFAVDGKPPQNPQDKLGDPLHALTADTLHRDYRTRINRGELAIPTWALHEALRLLPMLANYERLWVSSLTALERNVKRVEGADETRAAAQEAALRKAYKRVDTTATLAHLARANLYGFSVLAKHPGKLEPLNWWNFARVGLFGAWKWNPNIRVADGRHLPPESEIDPADYIVRTVEDNCLLEFLRIYLRASEIEDYWDGNLEKESKRQVVIVTPSGLDGDDLATFKRTAVSICEGKSGALAPGDGDKALQVLFPPESRGLPYYENRLKMLDEWACKALFGAPLIANTAPDSGTLAGGAHADTATKRIMGAAADISAVMQRQFDRGVLEAAGLLHPGEPASAFFELAHEGQSDPVVQVDQCVKLSQVFDLDAAEWSKKLGLKLAPKAQPQPTPGAGAGGPFDAFANRVSDEIGVPASWLSPLHRFLAEIADKAPETITREYLDGVLEEAKARLPELFDEMDVDAFARVLETGMSGAALEGVRDAVRAQP